MYSLPFIFSKQLSISSQILQFIAINMTGMVKREKGEIYTLKWVFREGNMGG